MKIYGITNKRQLGRACPCCRESLGRERKRRARQEGRREIRRELIRYT